MADIITLSSSAYEVRFYTPADVGTQDEATKIYEVSGAPYVVYKFENPDVSGATRLRLTETRGANTRVNEYAFDAGIDTWSLSRGNGLRQESLAISTSGSNTVKTITVGDGTLTASKTTRTYHTYPWGEELITEVLDPDGEALTTSYEFYDNSGTDGGAYGQLRQRINADGSWERRTYDVQGRPLKAIRPFLNASAGAAENLSRVTENIYTPLSDADGDSLPEKLTTTIETVLGTETARAYRVEWSKPVTLGPDDFARRTDIRCVAAGAAWDATGNLVTETLSYTTEPWLGRVHRVVSPDGTATLTTYSLDANREQTVITQTGQPNGALDAIVAGTRTVTFTSAQGQLVGEAVTDIASSLTLSSWTATELDAFGRPIRLDHADGTYETRSYACCGLATARDRGGLVTTYQYDALGRQTHVTVAGLTTRTAYDADNRVKSITRIGADSTEIVQQANSYDLAGRLSESKDALERTTAYAVAYDSGTGETTRTTTHPDAGTVIERSARDGSRLGVSGTAAAPRSYEYGLESGQLFTKEILVGPAGATTEWSKTYTDFVGRTYQTVYADEATAQSYYNAIGQLVRQVDPDGITTLYAYNARGEQEVTALDLDADNMIDYDGTDRITKTVTTVTTNDGFTVQRSTTTVWETDGVDTPVTVAIAEQSADGLHSWQTVRGLTTTAVAVPDGTGGRTITTTTPDGVKTIQVYTAGRLASSTVKTAADTQLAAVTYAYDPHGRQQTVTDARNGATSFAYFADDQIHTVTTPDPDAARSGDGYDPQMTTYHYDAAGRPDMVTQPDASVVNTTYWPTGAVKRTWGSRTYPVEYTYDPQGRVKTLTTWQDFAGNSGTAVTTWNYDTERGWLNNKRYADDTGPSYTYKPSGRLHTRVWARTPTITTTYSYNDAGDLTGIDYSDATPDVALTYDRAGRPKETMDAAGTRTLAYHASGQLDAETYTAGDLAGLAVDRSFDTLHRLTGVAALTATPSTLNSVAYGYDAASRLETVTQGTSSATYGYVANSALVDTVTFKESTTTRLTTTKTYDQLNRLGSIVSVPSAADPISATYTYNSANQRTRTTREDGTYWAYGYDALGQVTAGRKHLADATPVNGLDYAWTYDDIGNRKTGTVNGQAATYTATNLNQYSGRTVPGAVDVFGAALGTATVTLTVDSGTPQSTTRQGDLFHQQLAVTNTSAAQYPEIKVTAVQNDAGPAGEDVIAETTRRAFVAQTPEAFTHDADGNLTADARWTYAWDGENRLIGMETVTAAVTAGATKQKLEFAYDAQGRRFAKKVYVWSGSAWTLASHTCFLYDGWNLLAELDALASNAPMRTYAWGLDLSGSAQGAGGVGGLALATLGTTTHAAAYDGNGNVIGLVAMASGSSSASYDYNAFGVTILLEGAVAGENPFRFSSKYSDGETGLSYYGFRFYNPSTGRWLSRDPLGENESPSLYGMIENDPVNHYDINGLYGESGHLYTTYLVARAAGFDDKRAFQFAYWSQYPDEDSSYEAIRSKQDHLEIQSSLHSLAGGNPDKLRKYLECLLKSSAFSDDERGILIHALGDAYAHTYDSVLVSTGSPKNPQYRRKSIRETLYPNGIGHFLSGHLPDYIASDPAKYGRYVDQLYNILSSMNGGAPTNPDMIATLKATANGLSQPGLGAFFSDTKQNGYESNTLRNLPGGFGGSSEARDFPENENTPRPGMTRDADFRRRLLDKIKNGTTGCCPN